MSMHNELSEIQPDDGHPKKKRGRIFRFLLTGGPGAGKTASENWLIPALENGDTTVLFIPESATELISSKITAAEIGDAAYQKKQLLLQLEKEKEAEQKARRIAARGKNVLIFFDRGTLDGIAWWNQRDFDQMLFSMDLNEEKLRDRYDAVFHLESAACTDDRKYDRSTNAARIASPKEARDFDFRLRKIYQPHRHWKLIPSGADVDRKMDLLIDSIQKYSDQPGKESEKSAE